MGGGLNGYYVCLLSDSHYRLLDICGFACVSKAEDSGHVI
jgi:hypothetical protein